MVFENGVKNIQVAAYNEGSIMSKLNCVQLNYSLSSIFIAKMCAAKLWKGHLWSHLFVDCEFALAAVQVHPFFELF